MKLEKNNCLIFDYQDSFTYNIWSELKKLDLDPVVISFEDVQKTYQALEKNQDKKVLIHGPGPGHPEDYKNQLSSLRPILHKTNFFHLGLCLGHQMMMSLRGVEIKKSMNPMHGRKVEMTIPQWEIFSSRDWGKVVQVQRYNSLSMEKSELTKLRALPDFSYVVKDDDVLMTYASNQLTYQFHPESVGTTCPSIFFGALQTFLYN